MQTLFLWGPKMDGFKIGNIQEFKDFGKTQQYLSGNFEGIGEINYMIFQVTDSVGIIWNNQIMFPGLNGNNPVLVGKTAAYIDAEGNIWVGNED